MKTIKPRYKTRRPRFEVSLAGEPVWGNGCERRGCLQASVGSFITCADGITREFCQVHADDETFLTDSDGCRSAP